MPTASRNGATLTYDDAGGGNPPIVFIHGGYCDRQDWIRQLEHFSQRHRVIALDLPGHGESDPLDEPFSIEGCADTVAWLCEELGLEKPVVVGHSLGGAVSLSLVDRHPELASALVMLEPAFLFPEASGKFFVEPISNQMGAPGFAAVVSDAFQIAGFLPCDDEANRERVRIVMGSMPDEHGEQVWTAINSWEPTPEIHCEIPLLYIQHGGPPIQTDRLKQLFPQTIIARTVGAGHWAMFDVPEQVNTMLDRFIAHSDALATRSRMLPWP